MNTPLPPQTPSSQHLRPEQISDYLLEHRDFLQRHPAVFSGLELPHTVGQNTVSLQAKQVSSLREQVAMHEAQLSTLLANARNSEVIAKGLHTLTLSLLAQRSMRELPLAGQEALAHVFGLQDSAVRLWGTEPIYEKMECNKPVSDDIQTFADGLKQPYVGPNANFSAAHWLQRDTASLAMIALRVTPNGKAFGLLIIGSQDPRHFTADKSTDFLAQLGQVFSASLGRMLPPFS
jgi:uncharacterized protein YigA (DUF484 family)